MSDTFVWQSLMFIVHMRCFFHYTCLMAVRVYSSLSSHNAYTLSAKCLLDKMYVNVGTLICFPRFVAIIYCPEWMLPAASLTETLQVVWETHVC